MKRPDIHINVEDEWLSLMWEARQLGLSVQEIRRFLQEAQQEKAEES